MHNQWQEFLLTQGAQLDQDSLINFANSREAIASLASKGVICALDYLGCIRASGDEAQAFLQNQLSNDINQLQNAHIQLSAYCNPKGRMLAQFLIVPDKADFLLLLPRSILDVTLKRLRMFVLRSKVTLSDDSDEVVCLGLAGDHLPMLLPDTLPLPANDYDLSRTETTLIGKLPGPYPRFLVVASLEAAKDHWRHCASTCQRTDRHFWHWLDIQAGLPIIWPQTVEEFVPQMVNLELINGVNFKKGCYPGQEIVARMHYLGKPKRRMYHLRYAEVAAPLPGTDLYVAGGDGQSAGKIVHAEAQESLAVLQTDKLGADLRLGTSDGPKVVVANPPYSLDPV